MAGDGWAVDDCLDDGLVAQITAQIDDVLQCWCDAVGVSDVDHNTVLRGAVVIHASPMPLRMAT